MDPITHAVLPAVLLLAVNVDSKKVFSLLPLALVPDLDSAFGLWAHRVVFHNFIFIFFIPFLIFLFIKYRYPHKLRSLYIGWFLLISHLILDLEGGFAFLWPFSSKAPYFSFEITTALDGWIPKFFLNIHTGIAASTPEFTGYASILTPATSLLILLVLFSMFMNKKEVKSFFIDFRKFLLEKVSLKR